jgi:hypothetical protein
VSQILVHGDNFSDHPVRIAKEPGSIVKIASLSPYIKVELLLKPG